MYMHANIHHSMQIKLCVRTYTSLNLDRSAQYHPQSSSMVGSLISMSLSVVCVADRLLRLGIAGGAGEKERNRRERERERERERRGSERESVREYSIDKDWIA